MGGERLAQEMQSEFPQCISSIGRESRDKGMRSSAYCRHGFPNPPLSQAVDASGGHVPFRECAHPMACAVLQREQVPAPTVRSDASQRLGPERAETGRFDVGRRHG